MITTVTRQKFFDAIVNNSAMNDAYQGLSADPNNPAWIEFYAAKYIVFEDPLYYSIQISLNLTSAQMLALFQEAVAL